MRRLFPLLLALAACDDGMNPDHFKGDQPNVRRLLFWDGVPVAEAERFYLLDPDQERAVPLQIPGLDGVNQLGMRGTTPFAFGFRGTRRVLLERDGADWKEILLPEDRTSTTIPTLLAADASAVALWSGTACIRRKPGEDWKPVTFEPLPALKDLGGEPQHAVLQGDLLVLGYDRGEWGGALFTVGLVKGEVVALDLSLPVRQLVVDAQGRLWALQGLNHLGPGKGVLRVLDRGVWTVFCRVGNNGGPPALNWTLPPMSFDALDIDAQGHPWILGSAVGLARWDGRTWSMATRTWPQHSFNGDLYKVPGSGLRLWNASTALVAMGNHGIAVWSLGRERLRRISLKP